MSYNDYLNNIKAECAAVLSVDSIPARDKILTYETLSKVNELQKGKS